MMRSKLFKKSIFILGVMGLTLYNCQGFWNINIYVNCNKVKVFVNIIRT